VPARASPQANNASLVYRMYAHVRYNVFCFSRSTVCLCARMSRRSFVLLLTEAESRGIFGSTSIPLSNASPCPVQLTNTKSSFESVVTRKRGGRSWSGCKRCTSEGLVENRCDYAPLLRTVACCPARAGCGSSSARGAAEKLALRTPKPLGRLAPPGPASRIPTLGRYRAERALATNLRHFHRAKS